MEPNTRKVLLVEDDARLHQMMSDFLVGEQYEVISAYDGLQAIDKVDEEAPGIILLDMMLPGCDGLDVLHHIGPDYPGVIVMITAKKDEFLEVSALNQGVHDFITKPVRPHVLSAKLRTLGRLANKPVEKNDVPSGSVRVQDLTLNFNHRTLFCGENEIGLTDAEFELAAYLFKNAGMLVAREQIISSLRGIDYDGMDRSIDMRISTLRKKLNDTSPPYKYIKTVRSKGYILSK